MINEITASTSNAWITPPAEYAKNPIAHPITRITAMIYNIDLIVLSVDVAIIL